MPDIEHIQYVKTPIAEVYRALTTADGLAEIWTRELAFTAQEGAINEFSFGDEAPTRMEITELVPDKRMVWHCVDSDPEWIGTDVSFELAQSNGRTSVVLRHTGWRELTEFYRSCNYNWAMFLLSLKQYCEDGTGIPFQVRKF
ncbi:SRPBCC family protein [Pseudoxanthomonas wuyuanensis]|uniref:Uncharacterized conserved protein YndB, AHSA1/START domain n=1 Tax=Pseudoxanthomonas wuyuanensis TaxID=1073196 RepID=A0A286CX68_9GAMM|nr:SRPBCC domain-containing protein [Pseudoxanthomonas wuyuanensis]KAF1720866.1 SRPBCC domain-containing protein [Pseudoxanthomonas wuyuanensis]SOD50954.1 Uncharacterized conserved protein YndB, AHSA1/START domain [Pseudoxanthomonas wuyuanensis]